MKKVILCLLMVASYGFASASNGLETPKVKKEVPTLVFEVAKPVLTAPSEKVNVVYCVGLKGGMYCGAGETKQEALTALCITLYGSKSCP